MVAEPEGSSLVIPRPPFHMIILVVLFCNKS